MKFNLKSYAENLLFACNIFILFLLVFENKLNTPSWLQPVGRMHPVLLHFPIVILLLVMALEFFRFKTKYRSQEFYQNFTSNLFLGGILFSAVTILMGLFLAQEDGYADSTLQWHKWLGVSILFLTSIMYWSRNAGWYNDRAAKAGALVTTFALIFTGHYGAILTHGENFILAPVTLTEVPTVPLEQAVVFEHVIQPIFESKCISCHNPDKVKGKLMLIDSASIVKGGKTGKLFVAGKPEVSLLLQRIQLPVTDKKHMPPAGKGQLTPEETMLLYRWVKAKADFNQKVIDLPATDSLRLLAAAYLKPVQPEEEYNFAAADEQTIRQLNTNYRVVAPLAKASPALTVNVYNQQAYTAQTLTDLKPVKLQIVSLALNKLPVKDTDLKNVSQFQNLRRLNLNFTDITTKGLAELTPLPHLESLSLAGINLNYQDLQRQIAGFKNLRTVTLWHTGLTDSEIAQLQRTYTHINFISGFKDSGDHPIKLNPPQLKNNSPIFRTTLPLQLNHPIKDVIIRYTTNAGEPDSIHSPIFKSGMTLTGTTTLKAKAYKTGWLGSEVAVFNFYRSTFKPDSVRLVYPLNQVHQASGAKTFFDGELGSFNANSPAWANNWAGFFKNDMELISAFKQPIQLSAVALNVLVESENNIFPPATVEVWGGTAQDQLRLLATLKPKQPLRVNKPIIQLVESKFTPHQVSYLKIVAKPVKKLPEWHKSKGTPALLLIDEIFLN